MKATRRWSVRALFAAGFAVLLTLGPGRLEAQVAGVFLGGQISTASDTDFGLGGRVAIIPSGVNFELVGSVNVFFPDGPTDFWEANADLLYRFRPPSESSSIPYLGAGLNFSRLSNGTSDSSTGLNLLGGFRFQLGSVSPFVELRGVVSDPDQFVVSLGLLF